MAVRDFHTRSVLREERKRVTVNTNTSHHHLASSDTESLNIPHLFSQCSHTKVSPV